MSKYFLGIDTSCYTTSIAVVDEEGRLIVEKRKILEVKKGNRGLRQSEGIFQHMKNFPDLYEKVCNEIDHLRIAKVCCSSRPRNLENSYMPVFLSGLSFGKVIASSLNVPFEKYSHQEGHIEAARWSAGASFKDPFIALHISGGTTELLKVERSKNRYECEIIGGTKDISAGQLIDRIGVMMGLRFPAGKEIDQISTECEVTKIKLPVSTRGTYINFSGVETFTKRLLEEGDEAIPDIAKALFVCIYNSLSKVICESCSKYKINKILITGGVASNGFLRDNLYRELSTKGIDIYFGKAEFCTDNAVGSALLGRYK